MKKMKSRIIFPTILLIALLTAFSIGCADKELSLGHTTDCTQDFTDSSANHPKAAQYQALIDKYVTEGLPGIILMIEDQNGVWTGSSGYADISEGIMMQPCMVSKIASLTKLMLATTTMMLVDEGTLSLNAKISEYLPADVIDNIENADEATLRHLLNHSSGIHDVISDNNFYLDLLNHSDRDWTPEALLKHVYGKPAMFPLGQKAEYSNSNFVLISMILNEMGGKPHQEIMRERIFDPLMMTHTYYYHYEDLPAYVAQGYYDLYNDNTIINMTNWHTGSGNGHTGVYSTVNDVRKFINALFRDKTLLGQDVLNDMLTFINADDSDERMFGLGCYKDFLHLDPDWYAYGHRGRDLAYTADGFYFPESQTTLSLLINYGTNGSSNLGDKFYIFRDELATLINQ